MSKIKVHVHLDVGRSPERWKELHTRGQVFEESPYGYQQAHPYVELTYSTDVREARLVRFVRRGLAWVLGFDIVHASRNVAGIKAADVIWTHTEHESLAVALLKRLGLIDGLILGQTVWLWDNWARLSPPRRALYRWLMGALSVHTTLSPLNSAIGTGVLGESVFTVPFGIEKTFQLPPKPESESTVVRVVAPGNDRHRDWETLAAVARANPDIEVLVLSRRRKARQVQSSEVPNFRVRRANGVAEVLQAYSEADVVAIPLKRNSHASGITVAFEALAAARAIAVTRTGGIESYLRDAARYADPFDPTSLGAAIRQAFADGRDASLMESRRDQIEQGGQTARDYALRHVLLTHHMMGRPVDVGLVSCFCPVQIPAQ